MSFKNAEIDFTNEPGFKFLNGINEVEPTLGSNGSGKSSLWEALVWCLYNSTTDGRKASDLTNWGSKQPWVQVDLKINGQLHSIVRVGSPDRLTMDGKPVEQRQVNELLRLEKEQFVQAVVFGQAAPLFLDLSIPQRGELLDQVLNLGFWLEASQYALFKVKTKERQIQEVERSIARTEGQLSALPDITTLKIYRDEWELEHQTKIDQAIDYVGKIEDAIAADLKERAPYSSRVTLLDKLIAKDEAAVEHWRGTIVDLKLGKQNAEPIKYNIWFYEKESVCPECGQDLESEFCERKLSELRDCLSKLEYENSVIANALRDAEEHLGKAQKSLADKVYEHRLAKEEIAKINGRLASRQQSLDQATSVVEKLAAESNNPYTRQILEAEAQMEKLQATLAEFAEQIGKLKSEQGLVEYWVGGFKQVRLFLFKQVLEALEIEVNSAASTLGLQGWKIKFLIETTTKSGSTKSGLQVLVQSPNAPRWQKWSGGEGQRIRLAINIGLSGLIQRWAGVHFDWEVFDEPTTWLSAEGIDDLLECLHYRAQANKKSVWLVDQRTLSFSGFTENWLVRKTLAGSTVERQI